MEARDGVSAKSLLCLVDILKNHSNYRVGRRGHTGNKGASRDGRGIDAHVASASMVVFSVERSGQCVDGGKRTCQWVGSGKQREERNQGRVLGFGSEGPGDGDDVCEREMQASLVSLMSSV